MQPSNISFGLLDVRSPVNKTAPIHALLVHEDMNVLVLTGTWIQASDPEAVKLSLAPPGRAVQHVPRTTGRDGGQPLAHRDTVSVKPWLTPRITVEFESQLVKLSIPGKSIDIVCINRPPGNVSTGFLDEFSDLLDVLTTTDRCFMICGDFNCPGAEVGTTDPSLSDTPTRYTSSAALTRKDMHSTYCLYIERRQTGFLGLRQAGGYV